MKTIITELTANNQVVLRYYSRPNCLKQKSVGDSSGKKQDAAIASLVKKYEEIDKLLSANADIYTHLNYRQKSITQPVLPLNSNCMDANQIERHMCGKGEACRIPDAVEYVNITNNVPYSTKETYKELCERKLSYLDIIKKSQQVKKYERPWGKIQTVKRFTRNAKQKILEAGAVVDRAVELGSRYELTLTVPGSGVDVYDVIARYSGYLVNRITQIIRRWEAKGVPVHWFFVWEHQKRGALHMHWCIAIPNAPMHTDYLCRQIRAKWFELLEELSVKTCIDLFKKRGFSGTWRHSPEVWQANIAPVRKSVAAYFSKYISKTYDTSRFNRERRERQEALRLKYPDSIKHARVLSLCPSRYWGCASRVKRLCKQYRVNVPYGVASRKEGDYVANVIREWLLQICGKFTEVSRSFEKADPDTGFIYCRGWESKIWFEKSMMPDVLCLFKRMRADKTRKTDPIGAIIQMKYDW